MKKYFLSLTLIIISCLSLSSQVQPFIINHGPYLQFLTDKEVTIVWTTTSDAISWVEFYEDDGSNFYARERPGVFASEDGLKNIGKIHKVTLCDLKPSTKYAYRIFSRELISRNYSNPVYGKTVATEVYQRQPLYFTTEKTNKEQTSCIVLTDIHNNASKIGTLLQDVDLNNIDFVLSNGDFMGSFNREDELFNGGIDTCVDLFAKSKPLYMVRGNHETRGSMAYTLKDYFYFPQNKYYYTFNSGSNLFIVLDGGEDKPDSDKEYNGLVDFDSYRTLQAKWLKELTGSEQFKSAEHIIVFVHIPPFFPGRSQWHGELEVKEKFFPILNNAGIDLMISGHTHRHAIIEKNSFENNFPIIVMNNNCRMDLTINKSGIKTVITDINKKVLSQLSF